MPALPGVKRKNGMQNGMQLASLPRQLGSSSQEPSQAVDPEIIYTASKEPDTYREGTGFRLIIVPQGTSDGVWYRGELRRRTPDRGLCGGGDRKGPSEGLQQIEGGVEGARSLPAEG